MEEGKPKTWRFSQEVFPILLNKLWVLLEDKLSDYLKSGFRTCGLYPIDETEILKKLPQKPSGNAVQILNEAVIKMFESQRKAPPPKRKRGKKLEHYKAGSVLALEGEPHKNSDVEDDDHCSKSAGCSNANENVYVDVVNESDSSSSISSSSSTWVADETACYICENTIDNKANIQCKQCSLYYHEMCIEQMEITGSCIFCAGEGEDF